MRVQRSFTGMIFLGVGNGQPGIQMVQKKNQEDTTKVKNKVLGQHGMKMVKKNM